MNRPTSQNRLAALIVGTLLIAGCNCGNQPPVVGGTGGGTEVDGGAGGAGGGGEVGGGAGGGSVDGGTDGGTDGGGVLPDGGSVTLLSIGITPARPQIAAGTQQHLEATGAYSDGTTQDLSTQVTWASSSPAVATVTGMGDVSGRTAGIAAISATLLGITGSVDLTVTAATLTTIAVTPASATIAAGTTQQFVATGLFSDSTTQDLSAQVRWASSNPVFATISTSGLASAVAAGTTSVSATLGPVTGSAGLVVTSATLSSIAITPAGATIAKGTSQQFVATGTFSDGTTQDLTSAATWSSSSTSVATLSSAAGSEGLARGVGAGTTTITATYLSVSGGTVLTVSPAVLTALSVTPSTPSIPVATTQQFVATGIFSDNTTQDLTAQAAWSSSDTATASISNAAGSEGLATGAAGGSTTISATSGGLTDAVVLTVTAATLQTITVSPPNASSTAGNTRQYAATGGYSDGTTRDITATVTWASSNTAAATVSNAAGSEGLATAVSAGMTSISASLLGRTGTASLTVTAMGLVTLQSIVVAPANATISVGSTRQYTATGNYSDGSTQNLTNQVNWASTNNAIATVSNAFTSKGIVSGVAAGTTSVTATLMAIVGSTPLTVSNATLSSIAVTPATPGLPVGFKLPFKATGTYSDGSTQDITNNVTWASVTTAVATISNAAGSKGVASGVRVGTSSLSATLGVVSGSTVLTVNNATLTAIEVTPSSLSLARLMTRQLAAMGLFSNGTTLDITAQVTWSSSRQFVAQVSLSGVVTAFTSGDAVITAARGNLNDTCAVTVP